MEIYLTAKDAKVHTYWGLYELVESPCVVKPLVESRPN
jgi:hypothetical protein